jgi:hypothetical protein
MSTQHKRAAEQTGSTAGEKAQQEERENEVYGVGVTAKLGPANLARFTDGSIAIDGKKVDNPEDYKGKPLAGGPTDTTSVA